MFKKLIDWFNRADYFVTPLPYTYIEPKKVFKDNNRPGLEFKVPHGHIYLCPFEAKRLQDECDKKIKLASFYRYC